MTLFIITLTETVSVTNLQFCKHEDLRVPWERKSITQALTKLIERVIASSDTIIIAGTAVRKLVAIRSIAETKSIGDNLIKHKIFLKSLVETGITITSSIVKKYIRILSDSTNISQALGRLAKYFRGLTETNAINDVVVRMKRIISSDTSNISGTVVRLSHFFRTIIETNTTNESIRRKMTRLITTQTNTISGVVTASRNRIIAVFQTINISDGISRFYKGIRSIIETINIIGFITKGTQVDMATEITAISDYVSTFKDHLTVIILKEIPVIVDRIIANTAGPSWRWRFSPWKKDSFDNEFTPERHYPVIKMPVVPISNQLEMIKIFFKQRFTVLFPFIEPEDNES